MDEKRSCLKCITREPQYDYGEGGCKLGYRVRIIGTPLEQCPKPASLAEYNKHKVRYKQAKDVYKLVKKTKLKCT